MPEKMLNEFIIIKEYISHKEYREIHQLQELCSKDKTNLKLELDYKVNIFRNTEMGLKNLNEFLYYVDNNLVAYLGISCFGSNIGEINGMTHPDFRGKGLFKKLFKLAMDECQKRSFNKILLLCDGKSNSGIEFIKSVNGKYEFSEYRMKHLSKLSVESISSISLRKAGKLDRKEIIRQNAVYFNNDEENGSSNEGEGSMNQDAYMIELKDEIIGKINIEYSENSAYIFGFGILPAFRGKGYGKSALKEALNIISKNNIHNIELDVECKNNAALNLYKSCGFEVKSVMNYYKIIS